jgi:hypothetical protein
MTLAQPSPHGFLESCWEIRWAVSIATPNSFGDCCRWYRKVPVNADLPDLEEYSGEKDHASQDLHLKQNAFVFIHGERPFSLGYGHNLGTRSGYFCPRFAPVAPLNALYSSRFLLRILVVIPS